jgi:hypothetical protein
MNRARQAAVLMHAAEVADALRLLVQASNRSQADEAFTMQAGQAAAMLLQAGEGLRRTLSSAPAAAATEAVNGGGNG